MQQILHVILIVDTDGIPASLAILEPIDEERKSAAQRDDVVLWVRPVRDQFHFK